MDSDKKKIVIVGPAYPYRGGQALVEAHLFDYLTKANYDCHTITFSLLYPAIFFPGKTQTDTSKMIFFEHADRITRIINSINPFSWIKAAWHIRKIKPHAIIFVWWMAFFGPAYGTIAYLSKKLTKAKIIFLVENFISHENRWFDKISNFLTLRLADHFICQSDYTFNQLTDFFKTTSVHKVTLPIYDCFNLNRYNKKTAKQKLSINSTNVVLYFGLIRPYKGLDILIRAFPRVLEKYPDTTLLIVGECYDDENKYLDLIKQNNIQNRTKTVFEYVPNEALEPYFKAADLSCLPYKSGTQSGIAMVSYGFRVPVVVTDVGGLAETIIHNKTGLTTPPNQTEELAKGVNQLLELRGTVNFEKNISDYIEELGYKKLQEIFTGIINEELK